MNKYILSEVILRASTLVPRQASKGAIFFDTFITFIGCLNFSSMPIWPFDQNCYNSSRASIFDAQSYSHNPSFPPPTLLLLLPRAVPEVQRGDIWQQEVTEKDENIANIVLSSSRSSKEQDCAQRGFVPSKAANVDQNPDEANSRLRQKYWEDTHKYGGQAFKLRLRVIRKVLDRIFTISVTQDNFLTANEILYKEKGAERPDLSNSSVSFIFV